MVENFIKIQHVETGEVAVIDVKIARQRRHAMGFLNYIRLNPCFVKHITLTQRVENYHPRILNSFMVALSKRYRGSGKVQVFWSVEEQVRGVLHWHIMVAFPYGIDFGSEDVKRIQNYWKYGFLSIAPVQKPSMSYLMKYVNKSLSVGLSLSSKIRRIGSTHFPIWYRQSYKRLMQVISFFCDFEVSPDNFGWFRHTRSGVSIDTGSIARIVRLRSGAIRLFKEYIPLLEFKSQWRYIGGFNELPF